MSHGQAAKRWGASGSWSCDCFSACSRKLRGLASLWVGNVRGRRASALLTNVAAWDRWQGSTVRRPRLLADQRAHPLLTEDILQATDGRVDPIPCRVELRGRDHFKLGLDKDGSLLASFRNVRGRAHSVSGLLDFGQIEGGYLLYSVGERENRGSYSHRGVRKEKVLGRCDAGALCSD